MRWETDLAIWMPPGYLESHPSVRLRRLNIRKPLRQIGVRADLIFRQEDLSSFQNILLSHFNEEVIEFCKKARKQGKTLLFDHSEALWNLPFQNEVFNLCDYILCCSTELMKLTQSQLTSPYTHCIHMPDMAEEPHPHHIPKCNDQLVVSYTGMGGNAYLAKQLRPIIERLGMKLQIISEHADADVSWDRETYLYEMAKADIAICPQNYLLQPAKSNVKLVTAMALGLPTVSSPLCAYKEIVNDGVNGFIAKDEKEWESALEKLKDFNVRLKMSHAARITGQEYSPLEIAKKYKNFLLIARQEVAFINNTLPVKYMSYGDAALEFLRSAGSAVFDEYRYEDVDILPRDYGMYIFIEVRYDPEDIIQTTAPKVLITNEEQDINHLSHFEVIVTCRKDLAESWTNRGFVNVKYINDLSELNIRMLQQYYYTENIIEKRKLHNLKLHDDHINAFWNLIEPEVRWEGGSRDRAHIQYTLLNTEAGQKVLDIGSADGWLSLYLAKLHRQVSALEFVERGMRWTKTHAARLGVDIDLRYGFIESANTVFEGNTFDTILLFEILEHLDYWRLPWYLSNVEALLVPGGKVLVSLPKQDMRDNIEHLWSPNEKLIRKLFGSKKDFQVQWTDMPNHGVEGCWFIKYTVEK